MALEAAAVGWQYGLRVPGQSVPVGMRLERRASSLSKESFQ